MGRKRGRRGGKGNLPAGGPSPTPTPSSSSSPPSSLMLGGYKRSICLWTTGRDLEGRVIERWYDLNISSSEQKDENENENEKDEEARRENGFIRDETYIAFNHDERHDRKVRPTLHPNEKLNLLPTRPHHPITDWPNLSIIAGMGSKLYRIGGSRTTTTTHAFNSHENVFHLSRKVYYFDFNNGHRRRGWRRAPSMNSGRSAQGGRAFVLNGKLYVFGGRPPNYDDSGHWAEVFDPLHPTTDHNGNGNGNISKFWTPLPPPPPAVALEPGYGYRFAGVLDSNSSTIIFMVSFDGATHVYDVMAKRWETLGPYFFGREIMDKGGKYGPPVVVDKTVYWITDCGLNAYDSDQKMFFLGPIQDLGIWDHIASVDYGLIEIPITYLFHLIGELFCLIWLDLETCNSVDDDDDTNSDYVLHCTKFRVARGPFSEGRRHWSLCASVQSCHSYFIGQGDELKFFKAFQFD